MLGKWMGGIFGSIFFSPFGMAFPGLCLGIYLGHRFDKALRQIHSDQKSQGFNFHFFGQHATQETFFWSTFSIMGHIAKADGHISQNEIDVAAGFMQTLNMSAASRKLARQAFREGKDPHFNHHAAIRKLQLACFGNRSLLQLFLDIQLQAAQADGPISQDKIKPLYSIFQQLGFRPPPFTQQEQHKFRREPTQSRLAAAYQLLELSSGCSLAELKKAYRKKIGACHPDRLVAKGLPEEMIQLATEKSKNIRQSYEAILKAKFGEKSHV
jgi:DnaJ like chaperone protein